MLDAMSDDEETLSPHRIYNNALAKCTKCNIDIVGSPPCKCRGDTSLKCCKSSNYSRKKLSREDVQPLPKGKSALQQQRLGPFPKTCLRCNTPFQAFEMRYMCCGPCQAEWRKVNYNQDKPGKVGTPAENSLDHHVH
jgi:hypothetical protein